MGTDRKNFCLGVPNIPHIFTMTRAQKHSNRGNPLPKNFLISVTGTSTHKTHLILNQSDVVPSDLHHAFKGRFISLISPHLTFSYLISTDLTAFELSAVIGCGHGKLGHALRRASSLWL